MLTGRAAFRKGVKLVLAVFGDAVGVYPRMKLKAALVCALDPVGENVKVPVRRSAARAADVAALGEEGGLVKRVRRGAHLKKDRAQTHRRDVVEHGVGLGGERVGGKTGVRGVVDVVDACDPDAAHIVLCGLRSEGRRHEHRKHK